MKRSSLVASVLCLAAIVALAVLFQQRKSQQTQLLKLREDAAAAETVQREHDELQGVAGMNEEMAKLREQNAELLRLRDEIEKLRLEIEQLKAGAPPKQSRGEIRQPSPVAQQISEAESPPTEEERALYQKHIEYLHHVGLAALMFADQFDGQMPSKLEQLKGFMPTELAEYLDPNRFELFALGKVSEIKAPMQTVLLREKSLLGRFRARVYVYADGHSEVKKESE